MDGPFENPNCLTVRRLRADYLVSSAHPHPAQVRDRLDTVAAHALQQALHSALTPLFASSTFSPKAQGIWLIRRLHVAFDLNVGWDAQRMAQVWAHQIELCMIETLQNGDGDNLLWFPNRAALLARFLSDLAQGYAWGRWQYEEFEGLRHLPLSAALRTAICDQLAVGLDALLQLSSPEIAVLLQQLSLHDARHILTHLAAHAAPGTVDEHLPLSMWQRLWSAWQALGMDAVDDAGEARQALHLYVAVVAQQNELVANNRALAAAAEALVRLARHMVQLPSQQAVRLVNSLIAADLPALFTLLGSAAEYLAPLGNCPQQLLEQIAQELGGRSASAAAPVSFAEARATAYGGAFLLLPLLDEVPLQEATEGWHDAGALSAHTLIRFLLLVKCFGAGRAVRCFNEPLLRDLLQISGPLLMADVEAWQQGITPRQRQKFLATLLNWQRSRGAIRDHVYGLARLPAPDTMSESRPLALLFDGERGLWLSMTPHHPPSKNHLTRQRRQPAQMPSLLLCDPAWFDVLEGYALPFPHVVFDSEEAQAAASQDTILAGLLARRDKLADDLAYLSLPPAFGFAPALDHTLSIVAHSLLRALAWRLPGFALSSLPYLSANFMSFPATIEEETTRWCVRIGSPPLHLILNMSGMTRAEYCLSWFDNRPFQLFAE